MVLVLELFSYMPVRYRVHKVNMGINPHINLVNSVANWHIGKKFQNKNHLDFLEYTRELNHFLLGEKAPLANTLKNILHQ